MGRFTFKSMPQGICNSAALWYIMTNGDSSRTDSDLKIVKNMDDWMLYGRDMVKFLQFAARKNLLSDLENRC